VGSIIAIGGSGSFSADMSPTWFAGAYAAGWQPPLLIAALLAATASPMWRQPPAHNASRSVTC